MQDAQTPLYTAAYKGHASVVELLLAVPGVDVNAADKVMNYKQPPLV